tara:strand:- start:964 stop:1707 length:744 start_codon:yes stop_codon:yes gene_type:complete
MKFLIPFAVLVVLTGCKTQEEIRREQLVDNLGVQMVQSQKMVADATVTLSTIEERIQGLTGKLDELDRNSQVQLQTQVDALNQRMTLMEETNKTLQAKVEEQSKYLQDVLGTLKTLSSGSGAKKKLSDYDQAMSEYGKGRYSSAKPILVKLLEDKSIKGSKQARVMHNLGMISYMDKQYDKALVYFSRLFTEHEKTGYNKNGLLFLGRTFDKLGQKEQAKQTLGELIKRFPDAKQVKAAKEMLEKLK